MATISKLRPLLFSILISLGVGFISAYFTKDSMGFYQDLVKPNLSPPGWIFPVVWTILYILMGISAYLVYRSNSPYKNSALKIYAIQLVVNGIWSILFFNYQLYLFSFIWLLFLLILIVLMIVSFSKVSKLAAYLQIPYLLWVMFAGYLNFSIFLLNR